MQKIFAAALMAAGLSFGPAYAGEDRPFAGLSYSPSGIDFEIEMARGVSKAHVQEDLTRLRTLTGRLRTYTVDRGLDEVMPQAAALGFKVSLGIWLGPDSAKNEAEIARALPLIAAYPHVIERVYVGNETLQRKELSAGDLAGYIRRVRAAVPNTAIKISTGEAWYDWIAHPEVAAACDFIGAHLFPYWDGVPVTEAVNYLARRYAELRTAFPGKDVVIAETGWPSGGPSYKGAIPSPEAQERFMREFRARAAKEGYDYNFVEAYDQPWKGSSVEGAVGAYWGLFDRRRGAKVTLVR